MSVSRAGSFWTLRSPDLSAQLLWVPPLTQLQTQDGSLQTLSHVHCAKCQQQQMGSLPKSPTAGLELTSLDQCGPHGKCVLREALAL